MCSGSTGSSAGSSWTTALSALVTPLAARLPGANCPTAPSPPSPCDRPTDLVYLARHRSSGKNGAKRTVLDEEELLASMRAAWGESCGAVRVVNSSLWRTDRALLQHAAVVVAPHGGAIANLVFAPEGTTLLELIPGWGLRERPCYYGLAMSLGFRYEYVEPEVFGFNVPMRMGSRGREQVGSVLRAVCGVAKAR